MGSCGNGLTATGAEHPSTVVAGLRGARWPAVGAAVACPAPDLVLPNDVTVAPAWVFMVVALAVLVVVLAAASTERWPAPVTRRIAIGETALWSLAHAGSLNLLKRSLHVHRHFTGAELVESAADSWLTNMVVFALWHGELDQGGPMVRGRTGAQSGLLVSADDDAAVRTGRVETRVRRRPVDLIYGLNVPGAERHGAAVPMGQRTDGASIADLAGPDRWGGGARSTCPAEHRSRLRGAQRCGR